MNDRLEQFVKENREAFDSHEPNPSLWLRISPSARKERTSRRLRIMRYAAAAALLISAFSAGFYYLGRSSASSAIEQSAMYRELMETEAYYNSLVSQKYTELKPYFAGTPGMEEDLNKDMADLDQICRELKNDLKDDVDNVEVIEAMIQNYRMKLEILEDLLNQLKQKEERHEQYNL
ncbi:MAG: hypothetical protein ACOYXB_12590 [Bacteroidota bacterium]